MLHTATLEPGTLGLLTRIMAQEAMQPFYLVGGTALALQMGHRLSIDLDFFCESAFDKELVKAEMNAIGHWETDSENRIGLRGQLNGVKIDFVTYNYPQISPAWVELGVRMFSQPDIAAMKLSAVTNRGAKKDFYDIFFLLKTYSFGQLCAWYQEKYRTNNLMMVLKSITYFDDADQTGTPVLLDEKVAWTTVQDKLRNEVAKFINETE